MSIVRTHHNKSNPYVMLNKAPLEDANLSWAAKGLWAFLISKKDNWKVSVAHLSAIYTGKTKGNGRDAIYSILNELMEHGYCEKKGQSNGKKGQFSDFEYVIYEFKIILPLPDQPYTDQPYTDEPATSNKSDSANKDCLANNNHHQYPTADSQDYQKNPIFEPESNITYNKGTKNDDDLFFNEKELEKLNLFHKDLVEKAKLRTKSGCVQKANHIRVKFFFSTLENLSIQKPKPKLSIYEQLNQYFKTGEEYNGAICDLTPECIGFTRGMKQGQLEINKFWSWEKFDSLCADFGIQFNRG